MTQYIDDDAWTEPKARHRRGPWWVLRYWRWLVFPLIAAAALAGALYGARELGERVGVAIIPEDEVPPGTPVVVVIPQGAGAAQIAALLDDSGVVSGGDFERIVRVRGVAADLKAGSYQLETGMDVEEVVDAVVEGPGERAVYAVRIREAATVEDILAQLVEETPYTAAQLQAPLVDGSVTSSLLPEPADEVVDWEGLLFPATYELFIEDPPAAILQRPAQTMEARIDALDWSRLEELGITRYEAIIVASLIEAEAKLDEDRPLIASVIYNRLADGMPLQIDATVQYALPERKPRLLNEDLAIESPYNTYLNAGLPPTPIAAPSLASLEAAANPADTSFRFYVLATEDGKHAFAETLQEHQANVEQAREDGILPP